MFGHFSHSAALNPDDEEEGGDDDFYFDPDEVFQGVIEVIIVYLHVSSVFHVYLECFLGLEIHEDEGRGYHFTCSF